MSKTLAAEESIIVERRQNARLRAVFPDASLCIAEFFHGSNDWIESSVEYLAHRVVHESFPDLSTAEIRILIAAIERHVAEGVRQYLALEVAPLSRVFAARGQRSARP